MPKIKFSHNYAKLDGVDSENGATLLEVITVKLEECSEGFLRYDTDDGKYQLPKKGDFLMLIFKKGNSSNVFTTLRRSTPQKEQYYREQIGRLFEVEVVR